MALSTITMRFNLTRNLQALIWNTLDYILNSKRKRHIVGGILISMSTLFAGLAVTVMSIKEDDDE